MMTSFFDLQKYDATGIASANMTAFDKMRALAAFGGGTVHTLTGQPPLSFKADGTPLISWSMKGNGEQDGTPTPDNPVDFARCGTIWNHWNGTLVRYHLGKIAGENRVSDVSNGAMFQIEAVANVEYTVEQDSSPATSLLRIYRSDNPLAEGRRTEYDSMVEWNGTGTPKATLNSGSFKYIWVQFGGTWYDSYGASATISLAGDYAVPITCAGQTAPVWLGQTQTVRRVRKLVLTGEETIGSYQSNFYIQLPSDAKNESNAPICTHYLGQKTTPLDNYCIRQMVTGYWGGQLPALQLKDSSHGSIENLKTFFANQYANGTPVVVWYILATPQIGIVNEPLCKFGDYCDELHSEDAGVTIPTAKGNNILTIGTELQPSEMTITYRG